MISIVKDSGKWYAVHHTGSHIERDLKNVISSYEFNDKLSAELFAEGVLKEASDEE